MLPPQITENAVQIEVNPFSGKALNLPFPDQGIVQIWHSDSHSTLQNPPHAVCVLTPEENRRAARFKLQNSRDEFVAARYLLRTILAAYLKTEAREIRLSQEANGKPCLDASHSCPLRFNLSHSNGMIVAAFCVDSRVGIDIEKVRENFDIEEIWERFFSIAERQALRSVPSIEKYEAFFRCWTRKEAYIKARGEGLSHPLHQFDVAIGQDDASLLSTRPDPDEASRWLLRAITVPQGYVAAVAVEKNPEPTPMRVRHQPEHMALPS